MMDYVNNYVSGMSYYQNPIYIATPLLFIMNIVLRMLTTDEKKFYI